MNLTKNVETILDRRYLLRDENKRITETPQEMFGERIPAAIAEAERKWGGDDKKVSYWQGVFAEMLLERRWMANTPLLMNAGARTGMLFACFVLPLDDSLSEMNITPDGYYLYGPGDKSGIMDTALATTLVQKSGGGTGFSFSALRPRGDFIMSAAGAGRTSGPISFLRMMDSVTHAIQQGASRRGANMATFSCWHPSLPDFIMSKYPHPETGNISITNYNISVWADDEWLERVQHTPSDRFVGINPRNKARMCPMRVIPADVEHQVRELAFISHEETVLENYPVLEDHVVELEEMGVKFWTFGDLLDAIIEGAWRVGGPGIIFDTAVNENHPLKHLGRIEATNPCGEQPLLPFESCVLGHLNLPKYLNLDCYDLDWNLMRSDIHAGIRFLDNAVEINRYPLPQIRRVTQANRKVGLGVMGLADMFFGMGIRYGSSESFEWGEKIMKFVQEESIAASTALAEERGCFDTWEGSEWDKAGIKMRNGCVNTVAPTGTTARIAECSSSIEPDFGLAFESHVMTTSRLIDINPVFELELREWAKDVANNPDHPSRDFATFPAEVLSILEGRANGRDPVEVLTQIVLDECLSEGSIQHVQYIPAELRHPFVTARDVSISDHIKMQAVFQKFTDSAISKTINLPNHATRDQVREAYLLAHRLGCKGVTIFRDGCRKEQVLNLKSKKKKDKGLIIAKPYDVLSSIKFAIHTPWGTLHIDVRMRMPDGVEQEIMANFGRGDKDINTSLEGVTRLASLNLRAGVALDQVWYQLQGIGSRRPSTPSKHGRITSIPDAIAAAIKRYLLAKERFGVEKMLLDNSLVEQVSVKESTGDVPPSAGGEEDQIIASARKSGSFAEQCPQCGEVSLIHAEGCETCLAPDCGFSRC